MQVPVGMTEQEVLDVIEKIAKRLAEKFRFGYNDTDDMRQQARMFALECLDRYTPGRPLENFLQVHVHNRLCNYKRDRYSRMDKPCLNCPEYEADLGKCRSQCLLYSDKTECSLWLRWSTRNGAKKNLMQPIDLSEVVNNEHERRLVDNVTPDEICELNELEDIIDKYLDESLKKDYIAMKEGAKVSRRQQDLVKQAIKEIMEEHYE